MSIAMQEYALASAVSLGSPVAGDDCGLPVVTNDALAAYPLGNTTVTWTATDGAAKPQPVRKQLLVTDNENPCYYLSFK